LVYSKQLIISDIDTDQWFLIGSALQSSLELC